MSKSRVPKKPRFKKVKLNTRSASAIARQLEAFRKKFGRDPGPNDPVFFDPDGPNDVPRRLDALQLDADMLAAMQVASLPPQLIYAARKTGLMPPSERSAKNWPAERLAEWDAAIDEYFRLEDDGHEA